MSCDNNAMESQDGAGQPALSPNTVLSPKFTPPTVGELITSFDTGNTYKIEENLGSDLES